MNMTYHQACIFLLISLLVRIAQALKYSKLTGKHELKVFSRAGHHIQMGEGWVWGPCTKTPIAHAYTIT